MQSYRLSSASLVLLAFVTLLDCKASEQRNLHRRSAIESFESTASSLSQENAPNKTQEQFAIRSPYIVLMSRVTISIAQLPMIENGNLSDVYQLVVSGNDKVDYADFDEDEDEQDRKDLEKEETSDGENDEVKSRIGNSTRPSSDAREYEQQMPKLSIINSSNDTIASLGKSEWQQIASASSSSSSSSSSSAVRGREEVWPQSRQNEPTSAATASASSNRKEKEGQYDDEEERGEERTRPRRRRHVRLARRRRSNSFLTEEEDGNGPPAAEAGQTSGDTQAMRVNRAEESSKDVQNVTSAQSATRDDANNNDNNSSSSLNGPNAEQPISRGGAEPQAAGGLRAPAEADKNRRISTHIGASSSKSSSSSYSSSFADAQASSNGVADGIQFCNFDVHMSLGYAFVADSTGRIHRFKLPSGSSSAPVVASSSSSFNSQHSHTLEATLSTTTNEDELETGSSDNSARSNSIDANLNFEYKHSRDSRLKQSKIANWQNSDGSSSVIDSNNSIRLNENFNRSTDGTKHAGDSDTSLGRRGLSANYIEANKANVAEVELAHERQQLANNANERQHPSVSGESDNFASNSYIGVPTSVESHATQQISHSAEPRIIWSRNKFRATPKSSGKPSKKAQTRDESLLASVRGASPLEDVLADKHQVVGSSSEQQQASAPELQFASAAVRSANGSKQSNDSNNQLLSNKKRHSNLETKVAVDWLSNLLFVLDKYRLIVVDFDGNNELVLIDDFDSITRPIDIKVDPINNFLFWLQLGRFHNTIYKLDLSVLSLPSATQRLVANTLKLRQKGVRLMSKISDYSQANNSHDNEIVNGDNYALGYDSTDLVALVSRHYAHPIITNLPRQTKLFTIDHRQSRIYVPLSSSSSEASQEQTSDRDEQTKQHDETEVFAPSSDQATHLNSTSSMIEQAAIDEINCTKTSDNLARNNGQILAYNLDGTDVGPLRQVGENSHIISLDDIQDFTLDTKNNLLYWLTNDGKELFEEYKENTAIHPAQHNLDGRNYLKLMHFDAFGSNQPHTQRPRYNIGKIIHMLSSSISPNRWIRSDGNERFEENVRASSLNIRQRQDADAASFSRNAPYIILGVTCLIVITVYLIYTLIFQQMNSTTADGNTRHAGGSSHNGSIDSGSIGESAQTDARGTEAFLNLRWPQPGPSSHSADNSTFNRYLNSTNGRASAYDLDMSNYDTSNAIDEHYRDSNNSNYFDGSQEFDLKSPRLAEIGAWPSRMSDVFNKLYVPVEVLQDENLSSIRRISIDQLEIERKVPLGEGHFGTVLQGQVRCSIDEKANLMNETQSTTFQGGNHLLDGRNHPRPRLPLSSSSASSGHDSSSSTSGEFITANSCTENTTTDDYMTPKNQLSNAASDIDNVVSTVSKQICGTETKIRVAIKKLKDNASVEEKRDFLQEAKLLANFDHPNIVHLIGICLDRGSTLIVMELMLGGDLIRYMQENKPKATFEDANSLTYDDLLKICLDIVNGCCYLEDLDYIHRDLAARNCLVSSRKREERIVKLADFGLARDIYKDSYYKKLNDSAMPLKWMAPECLTEQKFTKKSDVWSFGVVMWEVMSYCQEKPYGGVEPFFMREHLASGARLRQPDTCDDDMYKLMNECWQMNPDRRPSFNECRATLIEIRNGRTNI